jgi:hypothetical protein
VIVALGALASLACTWPGVAGAYRTPPDWISTGSMTAARSGAFSVSLGTGDVLVFSGRADTSAELYHPGPGTFTATGSTSQQRAGAVVVQLGDGRVLAAGGTASPTSAEIYDPAAGTWSPTGSMPAGRTGAVGALLADGRVLVVGPSRTGGSVIYDPAAGTWAPGAAQTALTPRTATAVSGGKVLVTGPDTGGHSRAQLYDSASNTWAATDAPIAPISGGYPVDGERGTGFLAAKLADGRVFVNTVGEQCTLKCIPAAPNQIYDPATGHWTSTANFDVFTQAVTLPSGRLLLEGTGCKVYNPSPAYYITVDAPPCRQRDGWAGARLPGERALIAGGTDDGAPTAAAAIVTDGPSGYWPLMGPSGRLDGDPLYAARSESAPFPASPPLDTRLSLGPGLLPDGSGVSATSSFERPHNDGTYLGTGGSRFLYPGRAPFTTAVWVRPHMLDGAARRVVSSEFSTSAGAQGWLIYMSSSKIAFQRRSDGHIDEAAASGLVPQPHHTYFVVATYDGTTMRLYVDGQLLGTRASSLAIPTPSGSGPGLNYGAYQPGRVTSFVAPSSILPGQFAAPEMYDRALSQAEVQTQFQAAASGYFGTVAADDPDGSWPLTDTDGAAADESGHGVDGTRVGALGPPIMPNGDGSSAVSVQDVKPALRFGNVFGFPGNAPFSFEVWARAHSLDSTARRIVSKEGIDTGGKQGWLIYMTNTRLGFQRRADGVTDEAVTGAFTPVARRTYHIVATYDGATMRLYVNGALIASKASSLAMNATTAPLVFGAFAGDTAHPNNVTSEFLGQIAEPAVYDHALTGARVNAHYQFGSDGYESDVLARHPVGYWPLVDDDVAADESGHGITGTVAGKLGPGVRPDGTGASVYADGINGPALYFPAFPDFAGRAPFSFEIRVGGGGGSGAQRIVSAETPRNVSPLAGWSVSLTNQTLSFKRQSTAGSAQVDATGLAWQTDQLYDVLATYDGTDMRIYVDGELRGTAAAAFNLPSGSTPLTIGAYGSPGAGNTSNRFGGIFSDPAIYDRAIKP